MFRAGYESRHARPVAEPPCAGAERQGQRDSDEEKHRDIHRREVYGSAVSDIDTTTPDLDDLIAQRIAKALDSTQGRARLAAELWARLPAYIEEYGSSTGTPASTQLIVTPKTSQPYLVEAVVVSVPASGNLQLGDRTIYLNQAGLFVMAPVQILLTGGDVRTLTVASSGAMSLLLTGHQLPQWGTLR